MQSMQISICLLGQSSIEWRKVCHYYRRHASQVKGRRFVDEMSVATVAVRGERCLNSAAWIPARVRTDATEDRKACRVSQQPN